MHKIKRVIKRFNHPISSRGFIGYFVGISLTITSAIAIFNFIIDPYMYYRKPTFYEPIFTNARAQAAGLSRHFEFDSVLTGSSMAENFTISDLSRIMPNPIKLPLSGLNIVELNKLLSHVFKHKPELKALLIGIDIGSLMPKKQTRMPEFMYDDEYINDLGYLLSYKSLETSIKNIINRQKDKAKRDYNIMYEWQDSSKITANSNESIEMFKKGSTKKANTEIMDRKLKYDSNALFDNFKYYLKPFFISHPNTKFILFFPPYSMLFFKNLYNVNELSNFLRTKEEIVKIVQKFKNVEIFDFQLDYETILNLSFYGDTMHYVKPVNVKMIEHIQNNDFNITSVQKYQKQLIDFKTRVEKYEVP